MKLSSILSTNPSPITAARSAKDVVRWEDVRGRGIAVGGRGGLVVVVLWVELLPEVEAGDWVASPELRREKTKNG